LGVERIALGGDGQDIRIHWSDGSDSAVQERRFAADTDGVAVSQDAVGNTVVRAENGIDGQGTDAMLTYVTRADDLSGLAKLADPQAKLTEPERGELEALARKYGLDPADTALMASMVSGGGNVAGSPIVVNADEPRRAVVSSVLPVNARNDYARRFNWRSGVSITCALGNASPLLRNAPLHIR
jgi:hypothetical protein